MSEAIWAVLWLEEEMKFEIRKSGIVIVAETEQDEAYMRDTLGVHEYGTLHVPSTTEIVVESIKCTFNPEAMPYLRVRRANHEGE